MGTRSDIIVHRTDGTWKRIYCHWDGYLSHNGKILQEHYNSQKLAEALVKPGDLSSLGTTVGTKHSFDWRMKVEAEARVAYPETSFPRYKARDEFAANHPDTKKYGKMCLYYGRDRGEKNVGGHVGDSLQAVWPPADTWTEFTYVWDDGKWWVASADESTKTLVPLEDALAGKATVAANVKVPFLGVIGKHKNIGA